MVVDAVCPVRVDACAAAGNHITDKGALALANLMSCRRLLESLSLDGNSISNIGTVSLCTALLDSRFLRVLSLGGMLFT
jgi:hypothetical protein